MDELDPEIIRKLNEGIALTDEEMLKLAKSAGGAAGAMMLLNNHLKKIGGTVIDYGKEMYKGKQGLAEMNGMVGGATDALADLVSLIPIVGGVLSKMIKAGGEYTKAVNEMSDRLFENYQDLSKVGISAADGMVGLAESAQEMGFGLDDATGGLRDFAQLMKTSAQDLALFRGSAADGRRSLAGISSEITKGQVGKQLQNMGLTVTDINEGLASYIGLQSRVGMAQNMTQAQLAKGAAAYLKEMDGLTKLTGIQRSELEENINRARAVEAFRAKVEELREQGRVKEAAQMEQYYAVLLKQAPEIAQGYAESASGLIVSPAGRAFFQGIDSATGIVRGLSEGSLNAAQALQGTYQQAKVAEKEFRGIAQAGVASEVLGSYTQIADLAARANISFEEAAAAVKAAQDKQAAGIDDGTSAQVEARRAQMNTRDSLQNMVKLGVGPATKAMAALAKTTAKAAGIPEESLGIGETPGGKMSTTGVGAQGGGAGAVGILGGMGAGAAAGALMGGPIGALIGAVGGGIVGAFGGGGAAANLDDLFAFGTGTGSKEHFQKLQPEVQKAAIAMAQEYLNSTGRKLQINSAYRSLEEQAGIDSGNNPKAAPGKSLHNIGRALDLQSEQTAYLEQSGLLAKYGFKSGRAFNDPPHIYMRDGGIATGPKSGYQATLHGTEAVVPLPNNREIPVEMRGMTSALDSQVSAMGEQLTKLDEMVTLMRSSLGVQEKILRVSAN